MALKLMLVDDEPLILGLLRRALEPEGFDVVAFEDPRDAVTHASHYKLNGVFIDLMMPHLDGFEVTRRIRASPFNASIPVVMLTAQDDPETMRQGFAAGATFFLGKPFDPEKSASVFSVMRATMRREKIRHARLPLRTAVACTVGAEPIKATSLNISEGGMLLEVPGGADIGLQMELEFAVPAVLEPLRLRARVVNLDRDERVGVNFVSPPADVVERLRSYISDRLID
jgi:CheY-like chemotaxis protein